jgi:hypothetical protein
MKKFMFGTVITLGIGVAFLVSFPSVESAEESTKGAEGYIVNEPVVAPAGESDEAKAIREIELRESVEEKYPEINMGTLPSDMESPSHDPYSQWENNQVGFIQRIHDMTHQKVFAQFKQGAYEMSEENINLLLLELEEHNYYHGAEYYLEVLTEWQNGDFSNVIEVHNKIWKDQGGTIGEAERLLTPAEEQEFIETNFR